MAQHPHLFVPPTLEPTRFTSPSSGPRERISLPQRDRAAHAQSLISKLQEIAPAAASRAEQQKAIGVDAGLGIYLAFESEPNFPLQFESLDLYQERHRALLCQDAARQSDTGDRLRPRWKARPIST